MALDPDAFYAHALAAADEEQRLPLSRMTMWDVPPFEKTKITRFALGSKWGDLGASGSISLVAGLVSSASNSDMMPGSRSEPPTSD